MKEVLLSNFGIPSLILDPRDCKYVNVMTPGHPWGPREPLGFHAFFFTLDIYFFKIFRSDSEKYLSSPVV